MKIHMKTGPDLKQVVIVLILLLLLVITVATSPLGKTIFEPKGMDSSNTSIEAGPSSSEQESIQANGSTGLGRTEVLPHTGNSQVVEGLNPSVTQFETVVYATTIDEVSFENVDERLQIVLNASRDTARNEEELYTQEEVANAETLNLLLIYLFNNQGDIPQDGEERETFLTEIDGIELAIGTDVFRRDLGNFLDEHYEGVMPGTQD